MTKVESKWKNPRTRDVPAKVTEYLNNGGLNNPELMDHQAVRTLLIHARDVIEIFERQAQNSPAGRLPPEASTAREASGPAGDSQRRNVPTTFGRLYADDLPMAGVTGTWVRRAEVDVLLDEIERLQRQMSKALEFLCAFTNGSESQDFKPWARELYQKLRRNADEPTAFRLETEEEIAQGLKVTNPAYPSPPRDGPAPDIRRYIEPSGDDRCGCDFTLGVCPTHGNQ